MLILATDMARHAEIMDSFKDKLAVNFDFNNKEHMDTVCIEHMDRLCAEHMNKLWIEHMAMLCTGRIGCGRPNQSPILSQTTVTDQEKYYMSDEVRPIRSSRQLNRSTAVISPMRFVWFYSWRRIQSNIFAPTHS